MVRKFFIIMRFRVQVSDPLRNKTLFRVSCFCFSSLLHVAVTGFTGGCLPGSPRRGVVASDRAVMTDFS